MVWSFEGAGACKHIYIRECMYKYTLQKESLFFYSDCKHESNRSFKFKLNELIMYWKTCSNNSPDVLRLL